MSAGLNLQRILGWLAAVMDITFLIVGVVAHVIIHPEQISTLLEDKEPP